MCRFVLHYRAVVFVIFLKHFTTFLHEVHNGYKARFFFVLVYAVYEDAQVRGCGFELIAEDLRVCEAYGNTVGIGLGVNTA